MGMDLKPRNKSLDWLHFNWTGWGVFSDLLEQLGCDLSKMSGSNDGDYVDAKTAKTWAKTIQNAIAENKVRVTFVENKMYMGGGYEMFTINPDGKAMSSDDNKWILEIVNFLENSSGFYQY